MMYVILKEYPYEYSTIVGIYDSIDKLKQALKEQHIHNVPDTFYPQYKYTKTEHFETYTSVDYYTIVQVPVNTFNQYGYDDTEV